MYNVRVTFSLLLTLTFSYIVHAHSIHVHVTCTLYVTCKLIEVYHYLGDRDILVLCTGSTFIPTPLENCTLVSFMYVHVHVQLHCTLSLPPPHLSLSVVYRQYFYPHSTGELYTGKLHVHTCTMYVLLSPSFSLLPSHTLYMHIVYMYM